jgi:hypothetical protein
MKSTTAVEPATTAAMAPAVLRKDWWRQAECSKRYHQTKNSRNTGFIHFGSLYFLRNFWPEFQNGASSIEARLLYA